MIDMSDLLALARDQGKVISHDGAAIPTEISDLEDPVCGCEGTGEIEIRFGGVVIGVVPCEVCLG